MTEHELVQATYDDVCRMFLQGIQCVGGRRGVVYVTVPITSGYRLFKVLDREKCTAEELRRRDPALFRSEVLEPNMADAESWAEQARNSFKGRVVLDPSRLVRDGWSQDDYNNLWNRVIDDFVDIVIATPRWAFSRGARNEIEKAIRTQRKVQTLEGQTIPAEALYEMDQRARAELRSWGWSNERIDHELPPLLVGTAGSVDKPPPDDSAWHDSMAWVHEDIAWYWRRVGSAKVTQTDDARTADGLEGRSGWGPAKLRPYWEGVLAHSLATNRGRLELGSLVGASIGMLRSVWRVHGPLTAHSEMKQAGWQQRILEPTLEFADRPDLHHDQIATNVWTWLQQERLAMKRSSPADDDDRRTLELVDGDAASWSGELWDEHWEKAVNRGMALPDGRYRLGRFVAASFRLLESTTRIWGLPERTLSDTSRV